MSPAELAEKSEELLEGVMSALDLVNYAVAALEGNRGDDAVAARSVFSILAGHLVTQQDLAFRVRELAREGVDEGSNAEVRHG